MYVALAAEAIRMFSRKGVNAEDSKPRVFQGQTSNGSGGESFVKTNPRLCALWTNPAREQIGQRPEQEEKEQEKIKRPQVLLRRATRMGPGTWRPEMRRTPTVAYRLPK